MNSFGNMDSYLNEDEFEESSTKYLNQVEVKENEINTPFYNCPDFEKKLNIGYTENTLIEEFNTINDILFKLSPSYEALINNNINGFNDELNKLGKKSFQYHFQLKIFYELIKVVKANIFKENYTFNDENLNSMIEKQIIRLEIQKETFVNQLGNDNPQNVIKSFIERIYNNITFFNKNEKPCPKYLLSILLKYITTKLSVLLSYIDKYIEIAYSKNFNSKEKKNDELIFDMILNLELLEVLSFNLQYIFNVDPNEIFNLPLDNIEWKKLKKVFKVVSFKKNKEIYKQLNDSYKNHQQKILHSSNKISNDIISKITKDFNIQYNFKKDLITSENKNFSILQAYNILKNKKEKEKEKKSFSNIAFRMKLYMKKMYKIINMEFILKVINNLKDGNYTEISNEEINNINIIPNYPENTYLEKVNSEDKQYFISSRIFCSFDICSKTDKSNKLRDIPNTSISGNKLVREGILIYLHGGAFISMSTTNYEKHLRKLANEMDLPIISINYKMASREPYPSQLNDCWQGYNWIVDHLKEFLGIEPKKVILAGDSAGGNLVISLTAMLIATKRRVPDLIVPIYPYCDTNIKNFYPSNLISLTDIYLPLYFIYFSHACYRSNYKNEEDPFLNPVSIPDFILKQFPKSFFFLVAGDTFRDSTIKFIQKLLINSPSQDLITAYDFKYLFHGCFCVGNKNIQNIIREFVGKTMINYLDKK